MNSIQTFKKCTFLLFTCLFFMSCEQEDILVDEMGKTSTLSTSKSSSGTATAKYSTVRHADLPVVNRTNYYPKSNDAAGINEAITLANAAGGGTVKLESRTYYLKESIILKSYVRLLGDGMDKTILKRHSNFDFSSNSFMVGAIDASLSDVEVRSVKIDGEYSNSELLSGETNFIGIGIYSSLEYYNTRIRVILSEIKGCTMGIHIKGTTHITIQNSDIHDNGGTYLDHNVYLRRIGQVVFYKNNIYNSVGGSGLKLAGGTTNIPNESRYFTISQNNIYDNERINLNIQGCHHMLIEDNVLKSQKSTESGMAGIFMRNTNGYENRYTDIINNVITENAENGVYVEDSRTFNIAGNVCNSNGTDYNIIGSSDFSCDYNSY